MRILIIDDDEYKVNTVSSYIKEHNIDIAGDVCSGIEKATNCYYDIIFLDRLFPMRKGDRIVENYITVLRELYRHKITTPVVIISSNENKTIIDNHDQVVGYIHYNSSVYLKPYIESILSEVSNGKQS